jgi:hypothetical protein
MEAAWGHLVGWVLGAVAGPPITEVVPIRIHGHDSSWPPVLVFCALVVVAGGVVVALVFMRHVREALREDPAPR